MTKATKSKSTGSKTRFIEEAANGTWLADNATVVYLIGAGPYKIGRVSTVTGQSSTLFEGHTFDAVVWDAAKNQAFALGQNLNVRDRAGHLSARSAARKACAKLRGSTPTRERLSLSPSGKKIAFFADGDAIEVRDLANPSKAGPRARRHGSVRMEPRRAPRAAQARAGGKIRRTGLGGLYDGTFVPALHGLEYHAFAIAPDGGSMVVTEPGERDSSRRVYISASHVIYSGPDEFTVSWSRSMRGSEPLDVLLQNAAIHHHEQPRAPGAFGRGFVMHHAFLHPHRVRSDANRRFDDFRHKFRAPENVDDVHLLRNVFQTRVSTSRPALPFRRIHRNDAVSGRLHVFRDAKAGPMPAAGKSHHSDGLAAAQNLRDGIAGTQTGPFARTWIGFFN